MKYIPLSQNKYAIVDDEDFEYLSQWKWSLNSYGYARRTTSIKLGKRKEISLHREIIKAKKGELVDHINFNKLDNRKSNLRIVNASFSALHQEKSINNISGQTGVDFVKDRNKWRARISINKGRLTLGYFDTKEKATQVYLSVYDSIV